MKITPSIRSNFFTNAHPKGCRINVLKQIKEAKNNKAFKGPKNVLIIGGSSGYGLASRIALAYGANANTINVSYESEPRGKRTGSAGFWNNIHFQDLAKETNNIHVDLLGDAFSKETKKTVVNYIKETFGTIDLIIYSLAAGARKDEMTGEIVRSQIKAIGEPVVGKTIDIKSQEIKTITVETATQEDIDNTVFVMGGSDWSDWITFLDTHQVLADGVKTIAYTYVGGSTTNEIYRDGTIGKAKEDLEKTGKALDTKLQKSYDGEAIISSSKAIVSKASVFIPQMPIYVSCLFETMKKHTMHESILNHKHRLFKDMVYGDKRITDDKGRIRIDHHEMDSLIQKETTNLMTNLSDSALLSLKGTKDFLTTFYQINGFRFDEINYNEPLKIVNYLDKFNFKRL
ncbi:MAG: enoyl-[acyl-carrier-protein] reductase FabV [Candidatus Izimaplasma sp.]|nr:enoyl-[acyl-carrier-protein] reductase FabV [Candidatus Izimaplasma bacterium]